MGIRILSPLWLLLASVAVAITIPSTPTWPSGRCTDKSLTIPSWLITDYKVTSGTATFKAENRASESGGGLFECSSSKKECRSSGAMSQITATWSDGVNGDKVVGISQSWVCEDEGQSVPFTATGTTTIASCKGSDCTSPITYLAPGSLTLPAPLTPMQPSPPSGYSTPSCAEVGKNQWTVSRVNYKNYAKHQCKLWFYEPNFCEDGPLTGALLKGDYLDLVVTNNAIAHNVTCHYNPESIQYSLPSPLRCTGGAFNEITLDITFSGAAPNFILKVEELWYCLEAPSTNVKPSAIVASGSASIPMTCESHIGYTGTPDDIVTICTDSTSSHTVDAVQVQKKSLDPYSLVTAYPVHGGCIFDSIINPTFYYRKMFFQTNSFSTADKDNVTLKRLTAGLSGPGFKNHFFYNSKPISGSGIDTVYSCKDYSDGKPPEQHWKCTYSLNPFTFVFKQDKVWQCDDKNPKQPTYFEGSGTFDWSKNPNSHCSEQDNNLYCYWDGDQANFEPGVPYAVPKVTASLTTEPPRKRRGQGWADTVRVNGKWQKAGEAQI